MTDDLISRLRNSEYHGYVICKDAADALEAKDKRIADLEETVGLYRNSVRVETSTIEGMKARIAALEAVLNNCTEICDTIAAGWKDSPMSDKCGGFIAANNCAVAIRAARAALEGKDD